MISLKYGGKLVKKYLVLTQTLPLFEYIDFAQKNTVCDLNKD